MRLIPAKPHQTDSQAEYRVFSKLKECFTNNKAGNQDYVAFHSLNLTKHATQRFGEADFVIVCPYGLFVLEVKGGGVGVEEGKWHTINNDNEQHAIKNPFKQAEQALHSIHTSIRDKFVNLSLPTGYGVIVPDVAWNVASAEWDRKMICDSSHFKNFESWLRNFFNYWQAKPNNNYPLTHENIKKIVSFLRPNFECAVPLSIQFEQDAQKIVSFTEDQYKYLDIVAANPRVLCSGGAGTGKTFLAAELCRRIANEHNQVLLICYSEWLKRYLQSIVVNEFVIISSINSFKVDMKRNGIETYHTLIIDEGQDVFNLETMSALDDVIQGGLENGNWYIFHDVNNQSVVIDNNDGEMLEILKMLDDYSPAKVPLTTNCRNTKHILNEVKESLHLDMGNTNTADGSKVIKIKNNQEPGMVLQQQIDDLMQKGICASSISILSANEYSKSSVSALSEKNQKKISQLNEFSIKTFPDSNDKISFATISEFKGLENDVIIVIDLEKPKDEMNKTLHYVAMSRARSLLILIYD